jgi:hypothetical protein
MTSVARWDVLELPVSGPTGVQFRHPSGATAYAESFQSGESWLVRFSPDLEGEWTYDGGTFTCTPATSHGPVRRAGTTLRWADGTPYHPLTTSWFGRPDQWAAARPAIAASPFNRVRLAFSEALEDQVRDLLTAGIVADVILPLDEPVIRATVNRLSAYRNITWCLSPAPVAADVRRLAELIAELDPGHHLISMHEATDPGPPWLTHLSVRLENLRGVSALRRDHAKPVFVDACGHEGNGTTPDTSLRPEEMLTRIWEGMVRGAHVTHAEWYVAPQPTADPQPSSAGSQPSSAGAEQSSGGTVPWSAGGSRPTGVVAQRLRLLREVLDELPDGVEPIDDYRDAPTLAVPGSYYLQYLGEHQFPDRTFSLPDGVYDVDVLDVWNHSVRRTRETVTGTLTVRLPGTQYQAIQIRRTS